MLCSELICLIETLFMAVMVVVYLLVGTVAGFIAGLFGVGGGMIIVPALLLTFSLQGYEPAYLTHVAIGTSLATIIVTSISSVRAHHAKGMVRWDIFREMWPGLFIGALVGAAIARQLSSGALQLIIALFAWFVAYKMWVQPAKDEADSTDHLPNSVLQKSAGGVIGVASALFGIGGGSLTVPYLHHFGVRIQQAVATSSACGLPIALAGALGFAGFGVSSSQLPPGAVGFVHIPAFIGISLASAFTAPLGAKLAHYLPAQRLKQTFGVFSLIVGCIFMAKAAAHFQI